jgi:hypothetical protein
MHGIHVFFGPFIAAIVLLSLVELAITLAAAQWLAPFALLLEPVARRVALPKRGEGYRGRAVARPDYRAVARRLEVADGVLFRSDDGLTYVVRRAFEFGRRRNIWAVRIDVLETDDELVLVTKLVPTPLVLMVAAPFALLLGASAAVVGARWEVALPLLFVGGVGGAITLLQHWLDAGHRQQTVRLALERLEAELLATIPR